MSDPSEAQKIAGNYPKGHVRVHGMLVSVENAKGSVRKGYSDGGRVWSQEMQHDYGYIRGTKGKDKDHIDVFLGPEPDAGHPVHIIDQSHASGDFDEHKAMLGFPDAASAVVAYHANYEPGWDRFRGVTSVPMDSFKEWAFSGNRRGKVKPASEYAAFKEKENVDGSTGNEFAAGGSVPVSDLGRGSGRAGDKFGGDEAGIDDAGSRKDAGSADRLSRETASRSAGTRRAHDQPHRSLAQGGRVVGGRLHLDDGGSAGDGGDPGTGDPGAAGIGSGEMGTDAPASSGDPGVGDPGVMGVAQGDIGTSAPASTAPSGANFFGLSLPAPVATVASQVANIAAHGLGIPAGIVGMTNAAANQSPSSAASTIGGVIGGLAGLGPVGAIAGSAIGSAIGNMPGVPSASVPSDPTGATGAASSAAPSGASAPSPSALAAYQAFLSGSTPSDPMGTRRLLAPTGFTGSPAVYGNWGTGLQSGWGFARGGRVPVGPLTRVTNG